VSDLARALIVAIKVHADQRDKQGEPYLLHVLRVVEAVSDEAKIVAALHDVFEDGPPGVQMMLVDVVDDDEMQAILLLTRGEGSYPLTYAEYIAVIVAGDDRAHRLAREVKLADLRDNLGCIPLPPSPAHPDGLAALARWEQNWQPLKARYEKAIATLTPDPKED
jgi:hypothetical protein